jgi:hypothetical protein
MGMVSMHLQVVERTEVWWWPGRRATVGEVEIGSDHGRRVKVVEESARVDGVVCSSI